jgi:hypothetical protein
MKSTLAIVSVLLAATPLAAQMAQAPGATPDYLNDSNNQAVIGGNAKWKKRPDTAEQREARQKALARKAEAQALALADGGTMTKSHQRYIQKKADKIMSE